MQPQIYDQRR